MDLSDVYSQRVKKNKITNLSVGGSFPQIEKDPTIAKLEKQMFEKFNEIMPKEEPKSSQISQNTIKPLSFEEALRELASLQKNL